MTIINHSPLIEDLRCLLRSIAHL